MTKKEYIYHLKNRLRSLPFDEVESAVDYVSELFDEAGEENADQVANDLGSPAKFAAQIRAEYAINQRCAHEGNEPQARPMRMKRENSGLKTLGLILIGILALPVGLPLVLVLGILLFVLVIVGVVLLFTLGSLVVAGFAGLFALVALGIRMMTSSFANGLMIIGVALMGFALVILIIFGIIYLISVLKPMILDGSARLYERLKGVKKNEETNDENDA